MLNLSSTWKEKGKGSLLQSGLVFSFLYWVSFQAPPPPFVHGDKCLWEASRTTQVLLKGHNCKSQSTTVIPNWHHNTEYWNTETQGPLHLNATKWPRGQSQILTKAQIQEFHTYIQHSFVYILISFFNDPLVHNSQELVWILHFVQIRFRICTKLPTECQYPTQSRQSWKGISF